MAAGRRTSRGFTLIEMVVAAFLLFVGVTAAMACISSATRATGVASEYTTAALLAQQQFAQMEMQPDQISGGAQSGTFGDQYPGFTWDQSVDTTDFPNLVQVTLTVSWGSGPVRRSAQFVSYESTAPIQTSTNGQSGTTSGAGGTGGAGGG